MAASWIGWMAPADAQIPTSSTTTTQPRPSSTTSTSRQTTTTRPIVTTTTTRPSTTTSGSTTSTTGGASTTSTSRSGTTSTGSTDTTDDTEDTEDTTPAFTIPTPTSRAPAEDAPRLSPGSADISAIFPWLSLIGFGAAAALAGTRWYQTRPEPEEQPED